MVVVFYVALVYFNISGKNMLRKRAYTRSLVVRGYGVFVKAVPVNHINESDGQIAHHGGPVG